MIGINFANYTLQAGTRFYFRVPQAKKQYLGKFVVEGNELAFVSNCYHLNGKFDGIDENLRYGRLASKEPVVPGMTINVEREDVGIQEFVAIFGEEPQEPVKEKVVKKESPEKQKQAVGAFDDIILKGIKSTLAEGGLTAEKLVNEFKKETVHTVKDFLGKNTQFIEKAVGASIKTKVIEVKKIDGTKKKIGVAHSKFEHLLKLMQMKVPVLMVGSPGTGKTTGAEKIAEALDIPFHAISVGQQTTKSDILGFVNASGEYVSTPFRKAFEYGGIFLMDEIDAGNPNVLIQVNSAISNGFVEFPDGMIRVHEDFRFIGTANTYGSGSDAKFVGRNQLDAATLDRFVTINWDIDEQLEDHLCPNKEWLKKVRNLRKAVKDKSLDILVTPRMSVYGSRLIENGFSEKDALEMVVLKGLDRDLKDFVKSNFK